MSALSKEEEGEANGWFHETTRRFDIGQYKDVPHVNQQLSLLEKARYGTEIAAYKRDEKNRFHNFYSIQFPGPSKLRRKLQNAEKSGKPAKIIRNEASADKMAAKKDLQSINAILNQGQNLRKRKSRLSNSSSLQELDELAALDAEKKRAFNSRIVPTIDSCEKLLLDPVEDGFLQFKEPKNFTVARGNQEYDRLCTNYLLRCRKACEEKCAKINIHSLYRDYMRRLQMIFQVVTDALPKSILPGDASDQEQTFFDRRTDLDNATKDSVWTLVDEMWMMFYICLCAPPPICTEWILGNDFILTCSTGPINDVFESTRDQLLFRAEQVYTEPIQHQLLEKGLARLKFTLSH